MSIYRTVKECNYTIIDNDYLKDKNLSFGAIGLMTLLLSFKDDTKFNLKLISMVSGKSIKVVTKYLNELKKNNYVNVKRYTTKDGYYYDYFIYESKTFSPNFKDDTQYDQNETLESQPIGKDITNNNYIKQDKIIDKTKLDLCHLTEYIVDSGLININDMSLFYYDDFLRDLLNNEDYKKVIKSVTYTTNHIIKSKFKDEEYKDIKDLLNYFKVSVKSNINRQYTNEEIEENRLWY